MPRIKTTPMVRVALWALRIYLLVLLSLIVLSFTRGCSNAQKRPLRPGSKHSEPSAKTVPGQ